jgi:hypothetical protein
VSDRYGIAVSLDSRILKVEPGSETECEVRVRNVGSVVDRISIEVLGTASRWATVEPPSANLYPGTDTAMRLRFAPPRTSDTAPGSAPFTVRAISGEHPATTAEEQGTLEIGVFRDLGIELLPHTSSGRFFAEYHVTIQNRGNAPVRVMLDAANPDQALSYGIRPQTLTLTPGQETVSIRVRPRHWLWLGTPRILPFQVTATPDDGEPVSAGGHMEQRALLPRWLPRAAVAVGIAVSLLLAYLHFWGVVPEVTSLAQVAAVSRLQKAGFSPKQIPEASQSIAVGTVIRSAPDANARLRKGSSVKLYYSVGPNPIPVPYVIGLDGQEAVSRLVAASFVPEQVPQDNATVSAGRVVSSDPAANTLAAPGAKVSVFVSKGPPGQAASPPASPGTSSSAPAPSAKGPPGSAPGGGPGPPVVVVPPPPAGITGPGGVTPNPTGGNGGPTSGPVGVAQASLPVLAGTACAFDTASTAAPNPAQAIPGLAVTVNNGTRARNALVVVSANAGIDVDAEIRLAYSIDGGPPQENVFGPANLANHQQYWEARAATAVIPLAAGTHTITPLWRVSGASGKNAIINQRCMSVESVANP